MDLEGYSFGFEEAKADTGRHTATEGMEDDVKAFAGAGIRNEAEIKAPRSRQHRKSELYELSLKYEYRRAYSETKLLDLMGRFEFKQGHAYNFITGGDIDSLSFLKAVLRHQPLDHLTEHCRTFKHSIIIRNFDNGRKE